MLHLIATPVRIRAIHYAAALGLRNGAWKAFSTPESIRGQQGHVHILPGCSGDLVVAAKHAHGMRPFSSNVSLVDLTSAV